MKPVIIIGIAFVLLIPIPVFAPSHPEFLGTWNSSGTVKIIVNGTLWSLQTSSFYPDNFVKDLELRYQDYEDKDLIIDTIVEHLLSASADTVSDAFLERSPPQDVNYLLKQVLIRSNCSDILRDLEGVAVNMSDSEHVDIFDEYGKCASENTTNEKLDQVLQGQEESETSNFNYWISGIVVAILVGALGLGIKFRKKKPKDSENS